MAPADVHIVTIGTSESVPEFADRLGTTLASAGVRVLYDDRADASAGVKLKDAELIGVPTIVIVGKVSPTGSLKSETGDQALPITCPSA